MSTTATVSPAAYDWRAARRKRILAIAGTMAANCVVWTIAVPVAGVDLSVGPTEITLTAVSVVTLLAGLLAWTLLGLLRRWTRRPTAAFTWIAGAVLLVSLLGPLGADSTGAVVTLLVMHLVAGAGLIPTLPRTVRR
ncbi:DUF6069 family protein [Asanoa siamensis]|uniref:Uncharacterized protein n=1 Tax=Asanoa siamensis TaxID=926357 RepID=A0ABQ4D351_9ACTN|nr:DUF6069 family protein [Asanoa siamensis]GIF77557.1 hypothetical protein Asi02nite_70750 [Asanoa siamensis]